MATKRYTQDDKKPYGEGFGYGGFANVSFKKEQYEALHNGEIVTVSGVKSKRHPEDTYTVSLKYVGENPKNGKDNFEVIGSWVKDEKKPLNREAVTESRFGDVMQTEALAEQYANLSADDASELSERRISDMALAYQDEFGG